MRGYGNELPRAHSAPVYVHLNGKPVVVKEDVELMIRWLGRLWGYLEERNNFGSETNRALKWEKHKIPDAWKLGEGQAWDADVVEATEDEIAGRAPEGEGATAEAPQGGQKPAKR